MTSNEEDLKLGLDLTVVTREERDEQIDTAIRAGHIAIHCGPTAIGDQHLTIHPSGQGEVALWVNEMVDVTAEKKKKEGLQLHPSRMLRGLIAYLGEDESESTGPQKIITSAIVKGLTYEGYMRREGRFGRLVPQGGPPTEIMPGDEIILGLSAGRLELLRTKPVSKSETAFDSLPHVRHEPVPVLILAPAE
jgi:hypothetical protein